MPVNVGGLGSSVSFQDLQDFYGGSHPISLSEYYRGGVEVPSTAISGNNPYTGQTNFTDSSSGSGGSDGIDVTVTNRDQTITNVAANSGVSGTVTQTNPGGTVDSNPISGSIPAGTGFTFVNFPAPGARITSATSTAASNRNNLAFYSGPSSGAGSTGSVLYSNQQPRATFSGSQSGVRSILINAQNSEFEPRGHAGGTYSGFQQTTSATTYNVRYTNTTSFTIPDITTNHGTFSLGPGASRDFNNVSSNNVSRRDHAAVTSVQQRRQFMFTNNTGQVINLTTTAMGGNSSTQTELARGGTRDTGILNGGSEAWTYNYDITQAGGGSGVDSETNGGVVTTVTENPGQTRTVFGGLTTTVPISRGVGNFVITDWPNVSYVQVTQGGRGNHTVVADNRQYYSASQDDLPTSTIYFRGGAFQSVDAPVADSRVITFGIPGTASRVGFSGFRAPSQIGRRTRTTVRDPSTYDVSFRNDNPETIILDPNSTGGIRTLANGQTDQVLNDASSPNWNFNYRYAPSSQPANTAIPTSGEIDINQFNAPGNAAP